MRTAERLKHDVENELKWEPSVRDEQIGVSVKDGVVQLDGHVQSFYEKWAAEQAALRVANVKAIASEIKVDLSYMPARSDESIARVVVNHLDWNTLVPDTIQVKVEDGWVTLTGNVEWQYQRGEAERVIRPLMGVKGVSNDISILPHVSADGVKAKIESALIRDAQFDASHVTVEASGSTVTLRGHVPSWNEREAVEHAAFDAPGVVRVENLLEISY